jgi:RHS repeat-associated protein
LITYSNGRTIEQQYDAQGNLLARLINDPNDPGATYNQIYVYGTEFRGNSLESVAHQEGRLFVTGGTNSSPVWRYEYHISDHLGNTRLTFTDKIADGIIKFSDGEVLEESHYYPFGLAMDGPWLNDLTARDNRYKFNGIERVPDFGLNMDLAPFRSYDPAIGRWWQADPIAKAWESP